MVLSILLTMKLCFNSAKVIGMGNTMFVGGMTRRLITFATIFLAVPPSLLSPAVTPPATAQAALTALAVKDALSSALDEFRKVASQLTNDLQSLGNSLQANAQNVIQDLDKVLGDKINLTFDRLEAQERQLVESAQALTRQLNETSQAIIAKAGDETRRTLVEADITAYNTLYSLPCRDARPRVVAATPGNLTLAEDIPIISLRGNFLRQGADLKVMANGKRARVIERLDNSIRIELPSELFQPLPQEPLVISAEISGLETVGRYVSWFGLSCRERVQKQDALSVAITVSPQITHAISGALKTTHLVRREIAEPVQQFANTGSDRCDDDYRVDRQWCVTDGVSTRAEVAVTGANCHSGYEGYVPSGPRCVLVRGKVGGCGAIRGPFNAWAGCRGRGWLTYNITLYRTVEERLDAGNVVASAEPSVAQRSWDFEFPAGNLQPEFSYQITITRTQGSRTLASWVVSNANPNTGPVVSRIANGRLAIELTN